IQREGLGHPFAAARSHAPDIEIAEVHQPPDGKEAPAELILQLLAPRVGPSIRPTGRVLPLRFGRQSPPLRSAIGFRLLMRHAGLGKYPAYLLGVALRWVLGVLGALCRRASTPLYACFISAARHLM